MNEDIPSLEIKIEEAKKFRSMMVSEALRQQRIIINLEHKILELKKKGLRS